MSHIEARKIHPHEADAFQRIGSYAYGNWSDVVEEWVPEAALLNNLLATFADGTMTARLVNHSFEQVVRGAWRSVGAIGGVATLPEYRRQGHVRRLFDATFVDMREKGLAVAALYPFSESFYAKFGYIGTNSIPQVRLECSALNHLLPLANQTGDGWRYDRMPAIQSGNALQDFTYPLAESHDRTDYHGFIRDPARSANDWANEQMVFVKEKSDGQLERIVAVARYTLKGYGNGTVNVHEVHWMGAYARDRLLAFFALHGAGMPHLELKVPPQCNFHSWLTASAESYSVKMSHLPIMVRVMDVVQVLNGVQVGIGVGSGASGQSLLFEVKDEICPWVGGTFSVTAVDGILSAQRVAQKPSICMSIQGITALVYGTLPVREIIYRGWITAIDEKEVTLLEQWFTVQPLFTVLGF